MSGSFLNVFSGENSLKDFHDPDKNVYLPLVELPSHPFFADGVRIYAKMLTMVPSANVKALPALNMMLRSQETGSFRPGGDKIVEYSSGNTVMSLAILNRIYGSAKSSTCAYISNKTSKTKLQLLRFFGLELTLFGGPAQVEPSDPFGGIHASIQDGTKPNHWNPSQYSNLANSDAHVRWTGPQIARQVPDISVFAASIGTSGTMTGTGSYLKSVKPNIINVGVFTAPGDRVPGPRPIDLIQAVDLPWREVIDCDEHVTSLDSYSESLDLCRQGILCGPSSGLALRGLYQYLDKIRKEGKLDSLRASDGTITCVFICCDLPFQYIDDYYKKLPASLFPKINREILIDVDQYPYGVDWKIPPCEAHMLITHEDADVLDLRDNKHFLRSRIENSYHLDLGASKEPNPFLDPNTLARQWKILSRRLDPTIFADLYARGSKIVIFSYDGHSASVACSVMRHHGARAFYVAGGFEAWEKASLPVHTPTTVVKEDQGYFANRIFLNVFRIPVKP